jgi:molybdate transport system substrate-binding protein
VTAVHVLSSHAVLGALRELVPRFETASGVRLSFSYDPANVVRRRIEAGEAFDVAIATRQVIDALTDAGRIVAASRTDLGRCGLGLAVRAGAPRPEIGTAEAFKRALLAAKSIVRSRDGTSGQYFAALVERLGLADDLRDKLRLGPGGYVAELVARGEVDMAVQQISELSPVAGAQWVPFPEALQLYTVFTAGIGSACREHAAAAAFVAFLAAPDAQSVLRAKGFA